MVNKIIVFNLFILALCQNVLANWQIGTSGSSSSSSQSQSFKISQTFFDNHKFTLSTSTGQLTSDTTDQESSTVKLSYRWKISPDLKITTQFNQMDEYNLFKSQGFGLKFLKSFQVAEKNSSISFAIDSSNKQYSTYSQLSLGQRQVTLGFDQDVTEDFNFNISLSSNQYQTESQIINRRLQGSSILLSEVDSYVSGLPVSSTSFGFDYTLNELTTSLSISSDRTDPANPTQSIGQSLQFDYDVTENLNLGMGLSRSKEIGATTTSDSLNWSLNYQLP